MIRCVISDILLQMTLILIWSILKSEGLVVGGLRVVSKSEEVKEGEGEEGESLSDEGSGLSVECVLRVLIVAVRRCTSF